eukprot:2235668-Pleurochrysis_carterae.AAC.1
MRGIPKSTESSYKVEGPKHANGKWCVHLLSTSISPNLSPLQTSSDLFRPLQTSSNLFPAAPSSNLSSLTTRPLPSPPSL